MAIGTTALLAAGLGAAGSIGGAVIGSNATDKAADATSAAAAASLAEQKRQFDIGQSNQQPWLVTGTSALNKLGAMYGLDTYQPNYNPAAPAPAPTQGSATGAPPTAGISAALTATGLPLSAATTVAPRIAGQLAGATQTAGTAPQASAPPAGTFTPGASQPGVDPYADFYKSPDYQFRLTEGIKGLDASAAAGGSLDSGATRKAAIGYAGNLAAGEYDNYADRLSLLAGVGQTTATNLAGQGATYATNVGNIAQTNANNLASSYLAKGQNYGNTVNNLAGIGQGLIMNWPSSGATPASSPAPYNMNWG